MKLGLIVLSPGKMEGKTIPIRLPEFLIGHDPQCHLRPASPLISKRHCALLSCENRVFVRDFDTPNGTLINGIPIKGETSLAHGDRLKVGPLEFRVVVEGSVPGSKPTSPLPMAMTPDEEVAASLLLLADDDQASNSNVAADSEDKPADSTVRDDLNPETMPDKSNFEKKDRGARGEAAASTTEEDTSSAAKSLLNKYRRPHR
jgi:predicted component of type VI protein secretion system